MTAFPPFLRVLVALLATLAFYFALMRSSFGMDIPMLLLDVHQAVQLLIPALFFFIALHPSSAMRHLPAFQGKRRTAVIVIISLILAGVSEIGLLMLFGAVMR